MENLKFNSTLNETIYMNTLSSGIKCYIIPKKGYVEKQAVICTNYGSVDSAFETDGKKIEVPDGIAHFLEHKLFEDEKISVFDEFTKRGASVNAFTNFTNTAYYFNCIDGFDDSLKLLLDFTSTPYFTDENVEKEKGIISQEINMYLDNPFWQIYLNMQDGMYKECPVKKNIAGSIESIEAITKDLLYECYHTFYYPENMALICVGDLNQKEICDLVETYTQHLKPASQASKKINRLYGNEPKGVLKNYVEEKMPLARPMFNIGFKDSDFGGDIGQKIVGTKILMDIIAGESSEFFNQMYDEGELDGPFGMEYICSHFYGTAVFSGSSENPKRACRLLQDEIERVKKTGINNNRFEQIRKKHTGRFIRSFNTIDSIATAQVDMFSKGMDIFDLMSGYKTIGKDYLNKRLNELFTEDNYVVSVVLPK